MALHSFQGYSYQENGDDTNDLIPTILVHGAGSSHLGWPIAIRHLPGMHTIAVDLPNHGNSALKEINSIEQSAEDLYSFLDAMDMEQINLIGFSMGSAIVLQMLLKFPQYIQKAALISFTPQPVLDELDSQDDPNFDWMQIFTKKLFNQNLSETQRNKISDPLFSFDRNVLFKDLMNAHRYYPDFSIIKSATPVLFILGSDDPFFNKETEQRMLDHFPNRTVKILPQAGHLLIWEYPDVVQNYLLDFFKEK